MGAIPFGRQVRERRRALDLTQDELARRVGCAAITIRKIEAGALRASRQVAERLAVSLAVPPDERAAFVRAARLVLPADPVTELLLVIDQFEELFTLTPDEATRARLLDSIVTAMLDERSRLRIVVTLRADFIDRPPVSRRWRWPTRP
ncbi:MAG: hypothetical protein OHK0015_24340 [Chloroflexi bacterium OHK40]